MKRIGKFIFSRMTICVLCVILQVLLLILLAEYAYNVFKSLSLFVIILEMAIICDLSNRKMSADLKIPWLIVVMLFPLSGSIIYLLFSRNYARKKDRVAAKKVLSKSTEAVDKLRTSNDSFERYSDCSKYIEKTCGFKPFNNTSSKYYDCGETFFNDYIYDLKNAKKFIFMEYFIIERGIMFDNVLSILKEKIKEGVEVRIIYDDIGTIGKLPSNYYKKLQKDGIKCIKFNPFIPFVSAIHNNRDHRKITVIDGKIGYIGGINFADEYINVISRFGYWKDSAIRLEGLATAGLTTMFLQMYSIIRRKEENFEKYQLDYKFDLSDGFIQPLCDGPTPIYENLIGENTFLNLINHASKTIRVSTPYLILDTTLKNAIIAAVHRGILVEIYTPHIPDKHLIFAFTRSNYKELLNAGVAIYEYEPGFLHTKNLLIDDEIAIVGTINLDYRSLVHHYECGVMLYKTNSIKDIVSDFSNIKKESIKIDLKNFKYKLWEKVLTSFLKLFSPLM